MNTIDESKPNPGAATSSSFTESAQPVRNRFQADQVAAIAAGHFTHDTYSAFLAPLLPLIQRQLELSYALAGGLAIFTQLPSLLNPFIGYLADRVSVRYFVIFAPAITATIFSSIGLAPTYLILALLLFAGGLSIAAFHAPAPAMIGKVSGPRVGAGMSVFMASGELARAIGPIVAVAGVTAGMTVDQVANLDLVYAPPYSPPMDPLLVAANASRNKLDGRARGVRPDELRQWQGEGAAPLLVDVRSPAEHEALPFGNATLIPLGQLRRRAEDLPRDRPVVLLCKIGLRGYEGQRILDGLGFENASYLEGGVVGWPYEAPDG